MPPRRALQRKAHNTEFPNKNKFCNLWERSNIAGELLSSHPYRPLRMFLGAKFCYKWLTPKLRPNKLLKQPYAV